MKVMILLTIVVLTENYGKGYTGAMTSTYELIDRWLNQNINVSVFTLHIVGKINHHAKVNKFDSMFSLISTLRYISKIYHHNIFGYSDDHLGFVFYLLKIKYIHTYHGNWPKSMFNNGVVGFIKGLFFIPLYFLTISFASYVGSVSQHAIKFISKFNKNNYIIRSGTESKIKYVNHLIKIRGKLNIIMVGNIDERKYYMLLNILKMIPTKIMKTYINIDIYGHVKDINIAQELFSKGVDIKGFYFNIPYYKYNLFLNTSSSENLSIATIEALASGLPVIAFNVGGMNEIIRECSTGLIIPNNCYKKMSNDLLNIIFDGIVFDYNNDYILKNFNWNKSAKKYLILFDEMKEIEK